MDQAIHPQPLAATTSSEPQSRATGVDLACTAGLWSALIATGSGALYFLVMVGALLAGQMSFPPPGWLQLFGGIISFVFCPIMVVIMASLHTITPLEKRVMSQIALSFTLLFATVVTINRFVQLGVVRQSIATGATEGITWFLAYSERSIMFALEILGWGWFLGLAMFFTIPLFAAPGYQRWLRWMLFAYAVIAIFSAIAHLLASPLMAVGFLAWGLVLYLITALLALHFQRTRRSMQPAPGR